MIVPGCRTVRLRAPALGALLAGLWGLPAFVASPASAAEVRVSAPDSARGGENLARALSGAAPGTLIRLEAGLYELVPQAYIEPTCGNCEVESTQVQATTGLVVSGRRLRILGPDTGDAVIRTRAGYGLLFEECSGFSLERVTITGGERDTCGAATDAAVVVKRSSLVIQGCTIRDNLGDSTTVAGTVAGIMGIACREGSQVEVRNNRILRNSWDGIALYRGSHAIIEGNLIDGVDLARGAALGGGRGVGIGVTWNASAKIRGNLVRRYWKGIGGFVDAQITVEENVVEHVATWGLTLWDAGKGKPSGFFTRNVVYNSGACGASIIRASSDPPFPGRFVQNVLVRTGQDPRYDSGEPYCFQVPVARHAVPATFSIAENLLYENRIAQGLPAEGDVDERGFQARLGLIWQRHASWPVLRESDFWREHPVRASGVRNEP
jgi:hypothetical protein